MDGAPARVMTHAIRKAYTAAVMGRDTLKFKADLATRGGNLAEWGDARLTTLQGGVVVRVNGQVVGGLGVGGNTTERDTAIAQVALAALLDGAS
jgi:glc operon protein GlcG